MKPSFALLLLLTGMAPSAKADEHPRQRRPLTLPAQQLSKAGAAWPSNIIVIVMDDVGVMDIAQVATPNIDALAAGGLSYVRAYAHPWCKPTRDSLLLGSYEGMARSSSCAPVDDTSFSPGTRTFVNALHEVGFITANVGKWHLGRSSTEGLPWWFAPSAWEFDYWRSGLSSDRVGGGCNPSGNNHDDGVFTTSTLYETVRQRSSILGLIQEAELAGQPLFAIVNFTDAHSPWNLPPKQLLPSGYQLPRLPTERDFYEAEIMGLDSAIGSIVAALPADSWVILTGDNGTPNAVTLPPTLRAKGKVYERGVHVPLIFSGPGIIAGSVRTDPVHLSSLGATLLESLGIQGATRDGRNILNAPIPDQFVYVRNPTGVSRAVIEEDYKLIEDRGVLSFYSLALDPGENSPLPLVGPDYDRLFALLQTLPDA